MNMMFFYAAIIIMLIIIASDYIKKRYGFDMENVDEKKLKIKVNAFIKILNRYINKFKPINTSGVQKRTSGVNSLILLDAGVNKATVMATIRQITGIDYATAKNIVEAVPSELLSNASDKEVNLTKKALVFVGAKLEIKSTK